MALVPPTLDQIKFALRLEDAPGIDDRLMEMAAAAVALANRQAPAAPADIAREAQLRFIGWLYEGYSGDAEDGAIWRRSGAMGLLSRWTIRRAGLA